MKPNLSSRIGAIALCFAASTAGAADLDGFNARQLVTVVNAGTIVGNGVTGDGDGVDVDGLVAITNSGVIRSTNAFSPLASGLAFSEGVTVGGGTIVSSGTIEGLVATGNTNAVGRGITLAGNDIATGPLAGTREAIYGDATVTNATGGLIRGQSDSAIAVVDAARTNGQTFARLVIDASSAIDLGGASLTFDALGNVVDDAMLTISGFFAANPSDYAIRFVGDLGGDAMFRMLLANTTVDGRAATSRFDGGFTNVVAVPEPGTVALMFAGAAVGMLVVRRRGRGAGSH